MLVRLDIKDFVTIATLSLEFEQAFTALTGETGAGKSILIDALIFVCGARAQTEVIRSGCDKTEISAVFSVKNQTSLRRALEEAGIDYEDQQLILRRRYDRDGRSRIWANGVTITGKQARLFTTGLVDIHGQHAYFALTDASEQLQLLDQFGKNQTRVAEVEACWQDWQSLEQRYETSLSQIDAHREKTVLLQLQIDTLIAVALPAEEWETLNQSHSKLAHSQDIAQAVASSLAILDDDNQSVDHHLREAIEQLRRAADYDSDLKALTDLLENAEDVLQEAIRGLHRYSDHLELDPEQFQEIDFRVKQIIAQARAFACLPETLIDELTNRQQALAELSETHDIKQLDQARHAAKEGFFKASKALSRQRQKNAVQMAKKVNQYLQELALSHVNFAVALIPVDSGCRYGLERAMFTIAGSAQQTPQPLAQIASGGELSRIGLAISVASLQADTVPTLIFDEIDSGIGGGVAEVVGRLLQTLGQNHQVLCVTHLAQVAAYAEHHYQVNKQQNANGVATSQVEALANSARVQEIARMMTGLELTEVSLQHAQELLASGLKQKRTRNLKT